MTFAELVEDALEALPLNNDAAKVTRGEAKRLMNLAMIEVSRRVGAPQAYFTVPSTGVVTGAFSLPVDYWPESPVRVWASEGTSSYGMDLIDYELSVQSEGVMMDYGSQRRYDRSEADWSKGNYGAAPYLLYNSANGNAGFRPVGIESASYRFLLHLKPVPMVEDSDEPFAVLDYCETPPVRRSGVQPGGHRLLAYHVAYELLQRLGDQRWQAYYARFRDAQLELFSSVSPITVYMPGRRLEAE